MTVASQSIEDYIKAIFQLGEGRAPVSTSALAERLEVRPASVSSMLRRLERLGLVRHEPYHGVQLTDEGEDLGRRMIRRHRLIERFLTEFLDYPWDAVHDEAERLEHAVSPRFVEAIDRLLEGPATDPHGDPIPARDGTMDLRRFPALTELQPGTRARVRSVRDIDSAMLRHYSSVGLEPGAAVEVVAVEDDGKVRVRVEEGDECTITPDAASGVFMEKLDDDT